MHENYCICFAVLKHHRNSPSRGIYGLFFTQEWGGLVCLFHCLDVGNRADRGSISLQSVIVGRSQKPWSIILCLPEGNNMITKDHIIINEKIIAWCSVVLNDLAWHQHQMLWHSLEWSQRLCCKQAWCTLHKIYRSKYINVSHTLEKGEKYMNFIDSPKHYLEAN